MEKTILSVDDMEKRRREKREELKKLILEILMEGAKKALEQGQDEYFDNGYIIWSNWANIWEKIENTRKEYTNSSSVRNEAFKDAENTFAEILRQRKWRVTEISANGDKKEMAFISIDDKII